MILLDLEVKNIMKIDRLIGILSVLLQEERVTAPELAEKFEVSRRTINRDVEALCKAGIPISTSQGIGGGINVKAVFDASMKFHLMEEFGPDSFTVQRDGTLLFEHEYTDKDNLITWMLICKDRVTVLEPASIRDELFHIANNIVEKYGGNEHGKTKE